MELNNVIKYPLSTEKAIRLMESENKLIFIVDRKAKKPEIKEAIEKTFKVKVVNVTTLITPQGNKKAYARLSPETPALDISTDLGLM
jgi:large subunit ribosomal protein L23